MANFVRNRIHLSGIYFHIPFCRKACLYCDFHFSTNSTYVDRMVEALRAELAQRRDFLTSEVQTIYFGGGTPSMLSMKQLQSILSDVYRYFNVSKDAEVTLEANPDDLSRDYLNNLKKTDINRLSIGVQSFDDEVLQWMNRSHNARQSQNAVLDAKAVGFGNVTIDLIFGIPGKNHTYWSNQLDQALDLEINHLSVYSLTVEERTALHHHIKKGIQKSPIPEEQAVQFLTAGKRLKAKGYEHYEISNYALPGFRSKHNSSYWSGAPYLGIGPSAHSYDGNNTRSWNIANNHLYMNGIEQNEAQRETETLEQRDLINEHILTRLRTSDGLHLHQCKERFNYEIEPTQLRTWMDQDKLYVQDDVLYLTDEGKLIADSIAASLFVL